MQRKPKKETLHKRNPQIFLTKVKKKYIKVKNNIKVYPSQLDIRVIKVQQRKIAI